MNEFGILIPTIEDTILANAYEARMHFLYPDGTVFGKHITLPGQVTQPTAEAAQAELLHAQFPGQLMWVSFARLEVTGVIQSETEPPKADRYATVRHKVGEIALTTYPGILQPLSQVLKDPAQPNSFTKLWMGQYAMDRSKDSAGLPRHPLDDIFDVYMQAGIDEEFAGVQHRAEQEKWSESVDCASWYITSLALEARKDYPELFRGRDAWHKRMGIPLRQRALHKRRRNVT